MRRVRVAVATKGEKGLDDAVSEVFGRAKTVTIVDIKGERAEDVQVLKNPGISFRYGAGPILLKTLLDMEVDVIIAGELGPGVSTLIKDHGLDRFLVKPNTPLLEAIKTYLKDVIK